MPTKIIVSYDGTANEDDAIALGSLFARAGAEVSLAYVRHTHEPDRERETLVEAEAHQLLARGTELLGDSSAPTHVVTDRSTPEGLAALARSVGAELIVFCSDSHTAKGQVAIGNSAQRLIEGGTTAVAVAPVDFAQRDPRRTIAKMVAISDGDGGARATAEALASALGAEVAPVANQDADMLVIDSRASAESGHVSVSSSASYLIDIARCPVLVLPRARALEFGPSHAARAA